MQTKTLLTGLVSIAMLADAARIGRRSQYAQILSQRQASTGASSSSGAFNGGTTLDASVIQTGTTQDGNDPGEAGQVASLTSNNNYINFCQGQTLTNGTQITAGSCNPVPMGQIPASNSMTSTVITGPQNGQTIPANQAFSISLNVKGLETGFFTNATSTYFGAPQQLGKSGAILGHTHVTVQNMGSNPDLTTAPDPSTFTFFQGVNEQSDANGNLNVTVADGLPAGLYRLCTMSSSSNHQPVMMPVAQRGAQDDCVRFTVSGGADAGATATATTNSTDTGAAAGAAGAAAADGQNSTGAAAGAAGTAAASGQKSTGSATGAAAGAAAADGQKKHWFCHRCCCWCCWYCRG